MLAGGGDSSTGFWDADEPRISLQRRVLRTLAVAGVWGASVAPMAFGLQRCAVATLFHLPCPGCGMTRALTLLVAGRIDESLRMHALAAPAFAVAALLVASTLWATMALGSPVRVHRSRFGRWVLAAAAVVYVATFSFWVLRWAGCFGGPVAVG